MILLERTKSLVAANDITIAELERELGLSNGSIGKWNISSPRFESVERLADYFGVSIDYLSGKTDNPYVNIQGSNNMGNNVSGTVTISDNQITNVTEDSAHKSDTQTDLLSHILSELQELNQKIK